MQKRKLGKSNLEVSAIGLGCMGLSFGYGPAAERPAAIKLIRTAVERGVTFFDTAEAYGPFTNEELVGEAIRDRRDQVVVATKFGLVSHSGGGPGVTDSSPANVRTALEGSLKRLGTDYIDLYYQHRVDPDTPIEETVGAMAELVAEGKVRYLGLSEVTGDLLRRAHAVHPITAVQSEYSLWTRDVETPDSEGGAMDAMRELGVGFVPYSPLGRGFLTATVDLASFDAKDFRRRNPRFVGEAGQKNLAVVEAVRKVADDKGVPPAQIALAWVYAQEKRLGVSLAPIPGTKRVKYLEDNAGALDVELTAEDLQHIEAELPEVAGERYDESGMASVNR